MVNFRNALLIFLLLFAMIVHTACVDRQTPAQEMHEILEKVVHIEKTFEDQQEPLLTLEEQDQELYEKIIELNMQDHHEKLNELAATAMTIVEKRRELINLERQSMEESKKEFMKVTEIIDKIGDIDLKNKALNLYDLMQERYEIHERIYESYASGLDHDNKFYEKVKKDSNVKDPQLEIEVNDGNEAYKEVQKYNDTFNVKTNEYNEAKLEFYRMAGLNIQTNGKE